MKKLTVILSLFLAAANLHALKVSDSFFINSDFMRNDLSVVAPITTRFAMGLEASYIDHDDIKDKILMFSAPLVHTDDWMQITLSPFATTKADDLYAFGASAHLLLAMENNVVDDKYTQAHLAVSYANQKADISTDSGDKRKNMGEIGYYLALRKNFFNAFFFGVNGSAYQYTNGISGVNKVKSILDQNQIANINTFDFINQLPKYSVGTTFTRMLEKGANIYLSYSFIEYYTTRPEHSILVGNDFPIGKRFKGDIGYNHIICRGGSKRDIFRISLSAAF
ncbi:hypothetical protein AAIR98_000469 [Elusimicrobium simillimum]|uniref:hypothetical protein n=1 Tax=Elusimicrobium simillimum TaxID=3143438 RepID=UPI003C6EDB6B